MTKLQRRNLEMLLRFRIQPPTVMSLIWMNRRVYGLTLTLFGAIAWYFYVLFGAAAASYVGVALAVIILRDIGYFRRTAAIWPVNQTIIDWEKAGQLADADARQPIPLP